MAAKPPSKPEPMMPSMPPMEDAMEPTEAPEAPETEDAEEEDDLDLESFVEDLDTKQCQALMDLLKKRLDEGDENKKMTMADFMEGGE